MTFDEMLPLLYNCRKVKSTEWGDSEFIFRVPSEESEIPEWMTDFFIEKYVMEIRPESVYDEEGEEVFAVTILNNMDTNWEVA